MVNDIHRALKLARLFHGQSQKEVASALNLSTSHISELESGKKAITLAVLSKYADHFSMPPSSFLLFLENSKDPSAVEKARSLIATKTLRMLDWVADRSGIDRDEQNSEPTQSDKESTTAGSS